MTQEQEPGPVTSPADPGAAQGAEPEDLEPSERWPMVVGILGIVFAALTMLAFVCGLLSAQLQQLILGIIPEEQREEVRMQMETQTRLSLPYPAVQYAANLVELALAVVLLVGAIQILRRSRGGVKTLTVYAWVDLVANFIGAGIGLMVGAAAANAIKSDPSLAKSAGPTGPGFMMGMVIGGFLITCVWPVFLVLWLGREKVRNDVDRWDGGLLDEPSGSRG